MKRRSRLLAVVLCAALASGCATVTASSDGQRRSGDPTWSKRYWFLLGGFVSDKHVDAPGVCGGRRVAQVQSQHTLVDGLINLATLGILSPRTARVWCE